MLLFNIIVWCFRTKVLHRLPNIPNTNSDFDHPFVVRLDMSHRLDMMQLLPTVHRSRHFHLRHHPIHIAGATQHLIPPSNSSRHLDMLLLPFDYCTRLYQHLGHLCSSNQPSSGQHGSWEPIPMQAHDTVGIYLVRLVPLASLMTIMMPRMER